MTPRKGKSPACRPLAVTHPHAAGIDIGSAGNWVAVPPRSRPHPVCRFGAYTADLEAIADLLAACGVATVALGSTGVYRVPLFELLEARGFEVRLVDSRQAQRAPGRPRRPRCPSLRRSHRPRCVGPTGAKRLPS
jgi:transposase